MITLNSSFKEILGEKPESISPEIRKKNWEEWIRLANEADEKELVKDWTNTSACIGCAHLKESWCELQALPCTVNPVLSFSYGIVGMACYGAGKERKK